jgi:hypothetical protein
VKLLITLLVITAAVYGVYNFTMAAYGWFQMSTIVDEVAKEELAKPSSSSFSAFDARDRFGRIRERILKGAKEASVDLRAENVQLNVVNNVLDVQLAWDAPMVVYGDKTYLQIPMTMQRGFPVKPR